MFYSKERDEGSYLWSQIMLCFQIAFDNRSKWICNFRKVYVLILTVLLWAHSGQLNDSTFALWCLLSGPCQRMEPSTGDSPEDMRETEKLTRMFPSLALSPLEMVTAQKHPNIPQAFPTSELSDSFLIPQSQKLRSLLAWTMVQRHFIHHLCLVLPT